MFKYIQIAFRNVLANKRRSLFIGTAIAIGTIIMLMTASLSNGIRYNMVQNSFALFTGHVNVEGREMIREKRLFRIADYRPMTEIIKEEIPNPKIIYKTMTPGKIINKKTGVSQRGPLLGLDIAKEDLFREFVTVLDGDLFSIQKKNYTLIEKDLADKYDLHVGEIVIFEGDVESEETGISKVQIDLTVGAIIQGMSMGGGFGFGGIVRVSNDTLRDFTNFGEYEVSQISIYMDDKYASDKYADILEKRFMDEEFLNYYKELYKEKLISRGEYTDEKYEEYEVKVKEKNRDNITQDEDTTTGGMEFDESYQVKEKKDGLEIRVRTWQEEISFLEEMIQTIEIVAFALNIILMTIILLGISNTLIMSIRERTGEIGTLRAIGMQRPSVLLMFIIEGIIIGLIGTIIGTIIGGGLALFFTLNGIYIGPSPISIFLVNNTLFFRLSIDLILSVIITIVAVSAIASIYPSYKATKLKPITAMHSE